MGQVMGQMMEQDNTNEVEETPIWDSYEPEEAGYTDEDFQDEAPSAKPIWNNSQARQHAAKVAMADGENLTSESVDKMARDLQVSGSSEEMDQRMANIANKTQIARVKAAGAVSNEFGADVGASIYSGANEPTVDPVKDLEDTALANLISSTASVDSEEDIINLIDRENHFRQELKDEMDVARKWEGSTLGDVVDILGGVIPFNEQNTMRELQAGLEAKFNFGVSGSNAVAMGNVKAAYRDLITNLPAEQQLEVFRFTNTFLKENSGIISANDMLRTAIFDELFSGATDQYFDGNTDFTKYINNAVSALDIIGAGSLAKNLVRGGKGGIKVARNLVDEDSALATVERTSPRASAELKGMAIMDETGNVATELGTSVDAIKADLLPKWKADEDSGVITGASDEFNVRQLKIAEAIQKNRSILPHLKEQEITLQMESMVKGLDNVKGSALHRNASTITRKADGIEIEAILGQTAFKGFADIADSTKEVQRLQKRFSQLKWELLEKEFSGATKLAVPAKSTAVSDSIQKAREVVEQSATRRLVKGNQDKADLQKQIDGLADDVDPVERKKLETALSKVDARIEKANSDITAVREGNREGLSDIARKQQDNQSKIKFTKDAPKEYFIKATVKEDYKAKSNVGVGDFNEETRMWEDMSKEIFGTGSRAAWLGDISTNLIPSFAKSLLGAHNTSQNTQKLMFDMIKPLLKASKASKKRAIHLLQEGSEEGKVFSTDQIIARYMDDVKSPNELQETLEAYASTRNLFDTMYDLENEQHRAGLVLKNMLDVKLGNGFRTAATPIGKDQANNVRKHIFDTEKDIVREFSPAELADIYRDGGQVMKSDNLHGVGGQSDHIVVYNAADQVKPLPAQTLNKVEGYIPRLYDEQFFITVRPPVLFKNGVRLTGKDVPERVVAVSSSRKKAKEDIESLRAEYPDQEIDFKTDRSLNMKQKQAAQDEVSVATGRLFYSRRGEHIVNVQGELADTKDIMFSVQAAASSLARKLDLEPVIDLHKQRWINSFGHLSSEKGMFPSGKGMISNSKDASDIDVGKAKAYWDHIEMSSSGAQDHQQWRNWMFKFGEWLEGKGASEGVGSFFRKDVGEVSPLGLIRAGAFIPMIVFNPARQLFINTLQPVFLAGLEPTYILSGKAHKQGLTLFKASLGEGAPTKAQAKIAGMDFKEWEELVTDFRASGMLDSISNHAFARDAFSDMERSIVGENPLRRGISTVAQAGRKATNLATNIGFGAGESINRSITYMVARKRLMDKGEINLKTDIGKLRISEEADNLAMSMGQPGAMKYQQGIFSPAFQFFSIQHKMLLSSTSRALFGHGNRNLTRAEAGRIAMGQVLIYGSAGIGIHEAVDTILDEAEIVLEEDEKHIIYGGAFDYFVNGLLKMSTGDESDLAFAKDIAGGGGFTEMFGDMIVNLLSGDKTALEMFAGPSKTTGSRIATAVRLIGKSAGIADYNPDENDHWDMLTSVAQITSGANNFIKGMAIRNHGQWVSKDLTSLSIPASETESYVAQALGIQGYKVNDFYKNIKDDKKMKDAIKDEADRIFKDMARAVVKAGVEPEYARSAQFDKVMNNYAAYYDSLGPTGDQVRKLVLQKMKQNEKNEFGDVHEAWSNAIRSNHYGSDTPKSVRNRINAGLISQERGEIILKVWKMLHGETE